MDDLHQAFLCSKQNDYKAASEIQQRLERDFYYLTSQFEQFFKALPAGTEECVFVASLMCAAFENTINAYNFATQNADKILVAAKVAMEQNRSEVCRLLKRAICGQRRLYEQIFQIFGLPPSNETQFELMSQFALAELASSAGNKQIVIYALQFDQCVIQITRFGTLSKDERDVIWRRISSDSPAEMVFGCCKLGFCAEGIRAISEFCYEQMQSGNQDAAHALRNLVLFNGPANFMNAQGALFFLVVQTISQQILTFPSQVMESLAEMLADVFSYCSMSYISSFVDNDALDSISKAEIYADVVVSTILAAESVPRSDALQALFIAALRVYCAHCHINQLDIIEAILAQISTKNEKINFCFVCLCPEAFDLHSAEANRMFNGTVELLAYCTSLDDIAVTAEIIAQLESDADGEPLEIQVTELSVQQLFGALQATLNCMAVQNLKYQDNNAGTRIQNILYRFLEAHREICALAIGKTFDNAQCLLPDLILLLSAEPVTFLQFLHMQLLLDQFRDFVQNVVKMQPQEITELFSIICEFKCQFSHMVVGNPQFYEFVIQATDAYLSQAVDKQVVDFIEYCAQSNEPFALALFHRHNLVDFIVSTLYVHYSSLRLFKTIISADPQFAFQHLRELCQNFVFGIKNDVVGIFDMVELLERYQNATNLTIAQIAEAIFSLYNGLLPKILQQLSNLSFSSDRVQLRTLLDAARAAVFG